jgi:hypothetical protein
MDIVSPDLLEGAKILGFGLVVFIIWVLTIRFFEKILQQQQKQFDQFIAELSKRNTENFQVLNKFAEASEFAGGAISNLSSDINNNRFCPVVRDRRDRQERP